MWISFAFWPSFVATVVSAILVYMVLRANIRKPGNMAAFMMFLAMLIWSFGELIERIAGPPPETISKYYYPVLSLSPGPYDVNLAYLGAIILCIGIFLMPAALIHFSLDYPYRLKIGRKVRKAILIVLYGISLVTIIIDLVNSQVGYLTVGAMKPYKAFGVYLWGLESGPIHASMSIFMLVAALILLGILLYKLRGVKMEIVKNQILITVIGFLVLLVILVTTGLIPIVIEKADSYPLTTLGFSIFGIFVMYTIVKYRMFLVAPTTEEVEEKEKIPDEGIYTMNLKDSYRRFATLVRSGYSGIGFVTMPIEEFKKKYKLVNTPLFHISQEGGKNCLNPENPKDREMVSFVIMSMLEQVYKPIILLDLTSDWISENTKRELMERMEEMAKDVGGVYLIAN